MRRVLALSFAGLLMLASSRTTPSVVEPKTPKPDCTEIGTPGRDILAGTEEHDVICALAGPDYVHGDGKGDKIRGAGGSDTLVGGGGADRIRGGKGEDRIFTIDQRPHDTIWGGPGEDRCYADVGDKVYGCEHVSYGNTVRALTALDHALYDTTVVGQIAQEEASPSPDPSCHGNDPPPCG